MMVQTNALTRSTLGAGLKSIGAIARIYDMPQEYPELRTKVAKREFMVVGFIFAASLLLEGFSAMMSPRLRNNTLLQFVPQAVAYAFSEWVSRKMMPIKDHLKQALDDDNKISGKQPLVRSSSIQPAPTIHTLMAQRFSPSVSKTPASPVFFRAASPYPDYWQYKAPPLPVRAFR